MFLVCHPRLGAACALSWLALLGACHEEEAAPCEPGPWVDAHAWTLAAAEEDPFGDARPASAQCAPEGYSVEDLGGEPAFEIRTGLCDPITVVQPLLRDVGGCAQAEVRLWHFQLFAPDAGEAVLAIQLGDAPVWEERLGIPRPSGLVLESFAAPSAPAGTPVYFHLRNHGVNTYDLLEIYSVP